MTGIAKFFLGILTGAVMTVGGKSYYEQAKALPVGNNAPLSFAVNASLFRDLPASTYANNASPRSAYYPARWEWQMFGGLYDEGQDFTVAMQTCGERICSSYTLRNKLAGIRRIKRKNAQYKWEKRQRTIELSHGNFVLQDFIYREEDVLKWCTAFGSLPDKGNPKYFYGWHCAPQAYVQNTEVVKCVLDSLAYEGRTEIRDSDLECTAKKLVFTLAKPSKEDVKKGADIQS